MLNGLEHLLVISPKHKMLRPAIKLSWYFLASLHQTSFSFTANGKLFYASLQKIFHGLFCPGFVSLIAVVSRIQKNY
jgi:hypothetical protein